MRNLAAIFFLLIFSFQVLPVKAIGKLLSKNTQTEEVKDDCGSSDDDTPGSKDPKFNDLFHQYHSATPVGIVAIKKKITIIHGNDDLPKSHVKDVLCPPPNC